MPNGLLNNLVAYWSLEEAQGNSRSDATGHGHTMVEENGAPRVNGKVGYGIDIGGFAAQGLTCSTGVDDLKLSPTQSGTVACWAKFASFPFDGFPVARWQSAGDWYLYVNPSAGADFSVKASAATSAAAPNGTLSTGVWYRLCGWFDHTVGANGTAYFQINNGTVYSAVLASAKNNASGENVTMGYVVGGYGQTNAIVDEVGFWNAVLTADQRTALYNSGSGLDYASFDDGATAGNPAFAYAQQ